MSSQLMEFHETNFGSIPLNTPNICLCQVLSAWHRLHCLLAVFVSFLFFFFCLVFLGTHPRHMEVPRLGVQSKPKPLGLRHRGIPVPSVTYTTGHSNWALTHWARPGTKPTSSWMLVGFVNCWAMTGTLFPSFLRVFCFLFFFFFYIDYIIGCIACPPPISVSYVGVLTPNISECDYIWR